MHIQILFVAKKDDVVAVAALKVLEKQGFRTLELNPDALAPAKSLAIFELTGEAAEAFAHRHIIVTTSHKLLEIRPNWAVATPFVWGLRKNSGNLHQAVLDAAERFDSWINGKMGSPAPWMDPGVQTTYGEKLSSWQLLVQKVLGKVVFRQLTTPKPPLNANPRGSEVAFKEVAPTGRLMLRNNKIAGLRATATLAHITGITRTPVFYATSDAANVFELFQVLKAAYKFGIPAVFATYPGAHTFGYWRRGFLEPSLGLLSKQSASLSELTGLPDDVNYNDEIDTTRFTLALETLGVQNAREFVAGQSLAQIYTNAMSVLAARFLATLDIEVPTYFTTVEAILQAIGDWNIPLSSYAHELQEAAGYPVVVANTVSGRQFRTSDALPQITVAELHAQGGWLGGAALYRLFFRMGLHGGVALLLKDSLAGRVNRLALPFLGSNSGLHLIPIGLVRITAQGQNKDWSICPIVLLELFSRWNNPRGVARQIWNALQIPLRRDRIGQKTVVTVSATGIQIETKQ